MTPWRINPDDHRQIVDALLRAANSLRIERNRYRGAFIGASIVAGMLAAVLWFSVAGAWLPTDRIGEIEFGAAWFVVAICLGIIALVCRRLK